jgi:hypothetical protein
VKTGCNLAESSEEGYDSKRAVLPMMIIMMLKQKCEKLVCAKIQHISNIKCYYTKHTVD